MELPHLASSGTWTLSIQSPDQVMDLKQKWASLELENFSFQLLLFLMNLFGSISKAINKTVLQFKPLRP